MATIKIKRGLESGLPIGNSGEPLWTTDSFKLYVGNGVTNTLINTGGTVTSVGMTVPTGLSISGSPITTSGTLGLTLTAGYSIPTTASQTTWDSAYTNRITNLTTSGTSGAATLVANTLNIPQYQNALGFTPENVTNKQNSLVVDGTAAKYPTVDAINAAGFITSLAGAELQVNKDASNGYVGLTLFKINFKNVANTSTSFFTNLNTAARTYTFKDRNGIIADDTDLDLKLDKNLAIIGATKTKITYDNNGLITSGADATTSDISDSSSRRYVTDAQIASWNALIGGSIFQTVWNATTNTPTLISSAGTKGYYYIVSVAGSTNLDGITDWKLGDWAIYDGTVWRKVDNTDAVSSVNGLLGAVLLDSSNVPDTINKRYITDVQQVILGNTSGTNTGDNATNTQYSGLVSNATHTGDATGSTALTLATVNANVGSFTNANVTVNAKGLITAASNGLGSSGVVGTLNVNTTAVGNVGVGEDDLITFSVGGSTLGANGDYITFESSGTFSGSINSKRLKVKFGSTIIFDSGMLAVTVASDWVIEGTIIRTSATTFKADVRLNSSFASLAAYADYSTGTETLASALILKCTGEATVDNDVVQEFQIVKLNSQTTDALSSYLTKAANGSDIVNIATFRANLGVDKLTSNGDSNYTILPADKAVVTSANFTAPRTWTLPLANSVNPGYEIPVADLFGGVSSTNTLTIARAGANTINGATSVTIGAQYGMRRLISDGVSKWTFDAGVMRISDYIGTTLTPSKAVVTDANSKLAPSATTATQIGYLSTLSSDVQTQITTKLANALATGQIFLGVGGVATASSNARTVINTVPIATIAASSTLYFLPASAVAANASESARTFYVNNDGKLERLIISTATTQSATGSAVVTYRHNAVSTPITVTIAAGSAAGRFTDYTHSETCSAGDGISIQVQNNATANSCTFTQISVNYF